MPNLVLILKTARRVKKRKNVTRLASLQILDKKQCNISAIIIKLINFMFVFVNA